MISGAREVAARAELRERDRGQAARFGEVLRAARREAEAAAERRRAGGASPGDGLGADAAGASRRDRLRGEGGRGGTSGTGESVARPAWSGATLERRERGPAPTSAAEGLRAVVRSLPAQIEVARLAAGAQVTLAFGGALGVEVRSGRSGIEVTLRPAAPLQRVAAAELPGLVAALRARGLVVARADVRGSPSGRAGDPAGACLAR